MSRLLEKRREYSFKSEWVGYLFILPFFLVFAVFQAYPIFYSLAISLTNRKGLVTDVNFVGLEHFEALLSTKSFWRSLSNTGIIWGINFIPQLVFALIFAAIFTSVRLRMKGAGVFKVIYFMPNIITATSIAVLFASLFGYPDGPIANFMRDLGLIDTDFNFALSPWASRLVIAFIQFWRYCGHSMIILSAGILGINPTLYEAGEVDGASKTRMFFSITLPLLRPILLYTLVTSLVGGLQMFEIPYLYQAGKPTLDDGTLSTETIAAYIYSTAFSKERNYALASAASIYLSFIAIVLSFIVFKLMGQKDERALQEKAARKQARREAKSRGGNA